MFMKRNIGFVFMTSARAGFVGARVEMLVHAVVVDDDGVARFPVVADAVVDLVALAVEDVERRLVHVPVLLVARRPGAYSSRWMCSVCVTPVDRLDVMPAERLRAVVEAAARVPLTTRGSERSRASSSFRL